MANRYTEVLATYVRRPFSSWGEAIWMAFILLIVFSGSPGHIGDDSIAFRGLFLGMWLWLHFREQMVHQRRAITPHYVSTSTAVFVPLGLLAITWPALFMPALGHSFQANLTFSLAVYVFGLVGWAVAANSFLVMILCAAAFFGPLGYLFGSFPSPRHWAAPPCLLAAGLVAGFWAIWKLSHITEDQGGYGRMADEGLAFLGRAAGHVFGRLLGPAKSVRRVNEQESQITYGTPLALDGALGDTLRRWRHTGWALYLSPAVFVLCYFTSIVGYKLIHPSSKAIWEFQLGGLFIFLWAIVLPLMVLLRWQATWSCMAVESLRPESRGRLVRGVFLTIAFQILLAWLLIATTVWLASVIASHTMTGMGTLTLYLLATGITAPLACAVVFWLLPLGTRATSFAIVAVSLVGATASFGSFGPFQGLGVAAVPMALGLILIPFAYRHWLNMEMG